ncbi:PvcA protein [Pseudomonas synxantha]|uniref:PvcA protein n=1 Tax=Pseudomonas synxantha TaxID=47883 RepID=A0A3G7U552_9PSED|nr:isocyanide synthase family protein [Pseudomonas synxantha]AZE54400.1 PvcA protein [Pseudomonas synxantha]
MTMTPRPLSHEILNAILRIRRVDEKDASSTTPADEEEQIKAVQLPRIQRFIDAGEPIEFVLPAFPAKSPNPNKVLGRLPDLAERISLQSLDKLCADIKQLYAPGAYLTICSDGRVFGDVIGVDDADISAYQSAISKIIEQKYADHLKLYNLEDCALLNTPANNFDAMRRLMIERYAEPLDAIKHKLLNSPDGTHLYRAISRFMFEDNLTPTYTGSRSALQKKAKLMAVEVIQRSWAWGDLLAQAFPDAIRLSIHPQAASSSKIGIHMMPAQNAWVTPWHGVAVDMGDRIELMSRKAAQLSGAHLVMQDDQPSHYAIAPSRFTQNPMAQAV